MTLSPNFILKCLAGVLATSIIALSLTAILAKTNIIVGAATMGLAAGGLTAGFMMPIIPIVAAAILLSVVCAAIFLTPWSRIGGYGPGAGVTPIVPIPVSYPVYSNWGFFSGLSNRNYHSHQTSEIFSSPARTNHRHDIFGSNIANNGNHFSSHHAAPNHVPTHHSTSHGHR